MSTKKVEDLVKSALKEALDKRKPPGTAEPPATTCPRACRTQRATAPQAPHTARCRMAA